MSRYREVYKSWKTDPEVVLGQCRLLPSIGQSPTTKCSTRPPDNTEAGFPARFATRLTIASTGHVDAGRGAVNALIYDSPVTNTKRTLTYRELRDEVAAFAAVLAGLGIEKGDRVVIYMPMVPEAVIAMLATARLGAIHSVVFGGFASNELAKRLDDAKPKVVVSSSCGVEPGRIVAYKPLLDRAIEIAAHKPESCIILQRPIGDRAIACGSRPRLGAARRGG